jgi:isoleucyl-tRNA synthetase
MFHRVYQLIYNFCTVEMSSFYMDVLKDRMYCDAPTSDSRRSGQTAMYRILDSVVRMLGPVLVHTAEEAWAAIEHKSCNVDTVHLATMPATDPAINPAANAGKWQKVMDLRDEVLKALEPLRKGQVIGSNQEASVKIETPDDELLAIIDEMGEGTFAALCIISTVTVAKGSELKVTAAKSTYQKCARCWNYWPTVGQNPEQPELCSRCEVVVTTAK